MPVSNLHADTSSSAGFKASDFAIINTDNASEFEVEKRLPVQDSQGRKLDLRINYLYVRGARKSYN